MVNIIRLGEAEALLEPDPAAEYPLYLYVQPDFVLYTRSIKYLLNDERVSPRVCPDGISYLLQSGVVPPPATIYKDIYVLGIGDSAVIRTCGTVMSVTFRHRFPFTLDVTQHTRYRKPDSREVLSALATSLEERLHSDKPSFLFHSAGKDSNMIALAASGAGLQDRLTLITHKSKGKADESTISSEIAKKLGYKHIILNEVDKLHDSHIDAINHFFCSAPFPGVDPVTLAYPVYTTQLNELVGSNLIDGGGNDCYMMTPTTRMDHYRLRMLALTSKLIPIRNQLLTESRLVPLFKTPAEYYGMSGLGYRDARCVYAGANDHYLDWRARSLNESGDWVEHKTDIHTTITAAEVHIRKIRNFADSVDSNLVLPFANERVVSCFSKLHESLLFDRRTGKNKLIIREILRNELGLDSDAIGKMGYSYDFSSVIAFNWEWIDSVIKGCDLWVTENMEVLIARLLRVFKSDHKYSKMCARLIYRIFLISAWYMHCKYLTHNKSLSNEGINNSVI